MATASRRVFKYHGRSEPRGDMLVPSRNYYGQRVRGLWVFRGMDYLRDRTNQGSDLILQDGGALSELGPITGGPGLLLNGNGHGAATAGFPEALGWQSVANEQTEGLALVVYATPTNVAPGNYAGIAIFNRDAGNINPYGVIGLQRSGSGVLADVHAFTNDGGHRDTSDVAALAANTPVHLIANCGLTYGAGYGLGLFVNGEYATHGIGSSQSNLSFGSKTGKFVVGNLSGSGVNPQLCVHMVAMLDIGLEASEARILAEQPWLLVDQRSPRSSVFFGGGNSAGAVSDVNFKTIRRGIANGIARGV